MSYLSREVDSGARIAGGILGLIGGATIGAIGAVAQARDEKKRQQAAEELRQAVLKEQPPELADVLLKGFANSNHSPTYDFAGAAKRYHRQKLYRFLVFNVNEEFADAYFARETKFENYGLRMEADEVLERTATETKADIGSGKQLLQKYDDALAAEKDAYLDSARKGGGTAASYYYDTLKWQEEEKLRQEQLQAENAAKREANKGKGFWGFGKSA